jgi:hypothetical protein
MGYATEAVRAMVDVSQSLGVVRLYAICHVDHRQVGTRAGKDRLRLRRHPEALSRVPESRARVGRRTCIATPACSIEGRVLSPGFPGFPHRFLTEPSGLDSGPFPILRTGQEVRMPRISGLSAVIAGGFVLASTAGPRRAQAPAPSGRGCGFRGGLRVEASAAGYRCEWLTSSPLTLWSPAASACWIANGSALKRQRAATAARTRP